MVAAIPRANGIMKVIPPTFDATWCDATASTPSLPINSVTTEKTAISRKMVTPMGRPSRRSRQMTAKFGAEKRENVPARRTREYRTMPTMARNSHHITMAPDTPQPTPPIAGMPNPP